MQKLQNEFRIALFKVVRATLLALITMLASAAVWAAPLDYYLPAEVEYDPEIPTPESVFGFNPGDWHLTPESINAYLRELADRSDRVSLQVTGRTHEMRPLLLLTITSPENLANIDSIRERHLQFSEPVSDQQPVIAWMGYSVHGNEASGANASVLLAYHLAAGQGEAMDAMLKQMVVLLDPMLNPDGISRFAHWVNMYKGKQPVASRENIEHNESWPYGRTNHYWFDLNRDWLLLQHPESRARIAEFHRWKPNVLTDFHEMGTDATYFFQPGVPSRQNPLTPEKNFDLTSKIAQYHAKSLDAAGSLYYTKESFDDFYFGKGSTYPDINGSIGILFEQASARGHVQESVNGELSFSAAIRNQFLTSLSTLKATQEMRKELLDYQRDFYQTAASLANRGQVQGYIYGASDKSRVAAFNRVLDQHQIEHHPLSSDITIGKRRYQAGDYHVVPLGQLQSRLITALFETRTEFEDNTFYDVSAWNLPMAFNLEFKALAAADLKRASWKREAQATQTAEVALSEVGYAFRWTDFYAPRLLNHLLSAGLKARVAIKPFSVATSAGNQQYSAGTIVIPVGIQDSDVQATHRLIASAASDENTQIDSLVTGLASSGIDLGSPSMRPLEMPRPLLIIGEGVSGYEAGEIWHLLDTHVGVPLVMQTQRQLSDADLSRYTHLLMVSGNYRELGDKTEQKIKDWIAAGGTLMASKGALRWVSENEIGSARLFKREAPAAKTGESTQPPDSRRDYSERQQTFIEQLIGGAIFEADLDTTHPLAYGFERRSLPTFKNHRARLQHSSNAFSTVAVYRDKPLLSGYASKQNQQQIAGTAMLVAERVDDGAVILFADNPYFRGYWYGTGRLYTNGLFFDHTFGSFFGEED